MTGKAINGFVAGEVELSVVWKMRKCVTKRYLTKVPHSRKLRLKIVRL